MAVRVHVLTDSCISLTNSSIHHAFTLILTLREEKKEIVDSTPGAETCKKNRSEGDNCTAPVDERRIFGIHVYSHCHY